MVHINCKQTGQNLKDIIIDVLNHCGLDINNVYSCTTDNGANMLKASELFSKAQKDLIFIEKVTVCEEKEDVIEK